MVAAVVQRKLLEIREETVIVISDEFVALDRWLTLMPGESRTLVTGVDEGDTRGEKSAIVVCGLRHSPRPCRLCAVPSSGERAK